MTREEKLEHYINAVIEGMDYKTMYQYVYDTMTEGLASYNITDEQIDELYNEYFEDNDEETTA